MVIKRPNTDIHDECILYVKGDETSMIDILQLNKNEKE